MEPAEKCKSDARSKPQGWSPTEANGATTDAALAVNGVSAETISLATQTEIDVALARQDRIQADARQRASFQQHNVRARPQCEHEAKQIVVWFTCILVFFSGRMT